MGKHVGFRVFVFGLVAFMGLGLGVALLFSQQSPRVTLTSAQITEWDLQNAREIAAVKADIDSSKTILKGIGLLLISLNGIGAGVLAHVYKAWDKALSTEATFAKAVEEFTKLQELVSNLDCMVARKKAIEDLET
jgi:hypothetical protein